MLLSRVCACKSDRCHAVTVSDSQVNNHTSEYKRYLHLMSEMVTTISDAANAATTTIGGGGAQEDSEKGKEPLSAQGETQVRTIRTY